MMKFALGMMVAAVSADTAFLQMKATTKRVSTSKEPFLDNLVNTFSVESHNNPPSR